MLLYISILVNWFTAISFIASKIVDGRKCIKNNPEKGYNEERLVIDILMHLVLERTVVRERAEKRGGRET